MKTGLVRTAVVASADRLFAEAAAALVDAQEGWRVGGIASDGLQALALATRVRPSCVLVVGELPRVRAGILARQVARRSPDTTVVTVASGVGDPGGHVLPFEANASEILKAMASAPHPTIDAPPEPMDDAMALLSDLTRRERVTLTLLAEGRTRDEIAARLGISTHTVRTHMQNLYGKLGVHSRLELVHFAGRHGLVVVDGASGSGRHGQQMG